MTRQQAIDIASKGQGGGQAINFSCAGFVDCLAALGVIKIDEPKTRRDLFKDAMAKAGYHENSAGMFDALAAFDACEK